MGYLLVIICTLMWSFVGFFVKTASFTFDSSTITFARFFIGVIALIIFARITKQTIRWNFTSRLIWLGVIGKCVNYLCENAAIAIGFSYGNILVPPIQTITLIFISVLYFKQSLRSIEWVAVILCLTGVFLVQWNGVSLSEFFSNAILLILFVLSGIGASMHVLSQKLLVNKMDTGSMNASTFLLCSLVVFTPIPFQFEVQKTVPAMAVLSLIALGLITAFSFYLFAKALKLVPFTAAIILINSGILFTILWGKLFFNESVSLVVWVGAIFLLAGIVLTNWPAAKKTENRAQVKDV
jgi:drug/metabolite transporter (DMT)-like permease